MRRMVFRFTLIISLITLIVVSSARSIGTVYGRSILIWEHQYLPSSPATILWDNGRFFRLRDSLRIRDFRWNADGRWAWIALGAGNRGIRVQVWQDGHAITVSEPDSFNMDVHWLDDTRLVWRSWVSGSAGQVYTWDGTITRLDDSLTDGQVSNLPPRIIAEDGRVVSVQRIANDILAILVMEGDTAVAIYGDYGLIRNIEWSR